jgi:putative transposase
MRLPRYIVPDRYEYGIYHVISRTVDRQMVFGDEEKEKMVSFMKRYAEFAGIKVLTFCVMGNHFHWLLYVPARPKDAEQMADADLVRRVKRCQGGHAAWELEQDLGYMLKNGWTDQHQKLRAKWLARMWNLSAFVQSVKQRFTVWFNKKHERKGTLWEERFKSVVLMGSEAVASCAAYIDLNPVRAKLVDDPKDYRWSGYGEAVGGVPESIKGLIHALTKLRGPMIPANAKAVDILAWYREWIYIRGEQRGAITDPSSPSEFQPVKPGFSSEEVQAVRAAKGQLPASDVLMKRVRHFSDGLVIGGKDALQELFEATKDYFGPKRKTGPRKIKGDDWGDLRSMRELRR